MTTTAGGDPRGMTVDMATAARRGARMRAGGRHARTTMRRHTRGTPDRAAGPRGGTTTAVGAPLHEETTMVNGDPRGERMARGARALRTTAMRIAIAAGRRGRAAMAVRGGRGDTTLPSGRARREPTTTRGTRVASGDPGRRGATTRGNTTHQSRVRGAMARLDIRGGKAGGATTRPCVQSSGPRRMVLLSMVLLSMVLLSMSKPGTVPPTRRRGWVCQRATGRSTGRAMGRWARQALRRR
jgi:hypothetical protein